MDRVLDLLRADPRPGDTMTVWGRLLCQPTPLLASACFEFFACPTDSVDRLDQAARSAWPLLEGDAVRLRENCVGKTVYPLYGADPDHLHRHALDLVAAAMLLGWLRPGPAASPVSPDAVQFWLQRFARNEPLPDTLDRLGGVAVAERRQTLGRLLSPATATRLRMHERYLSGRPEPRPVRVHFPYYDSPTTGGVFALEVWHEADGAPELYHDPAGLAQPLAANTLRVIGAAHQRYPTTRPAVWRVRRLSKLNGNVHTLDGESPSAAACIAFRALADGRDVDQGCVVSAWFGYSVGDGDPPAAWGRPESPLCAVLGLEQKAGAACVQFTQFDRLLHNDPGFRHPDGRFTLPVIDENGRAHTHTLTERAMATLDDAYQDASGLIGELRTYYKQCQNHLDTEGRKAEFLAGRPLSTLYIQPDVLKDVIRPAREPDRPGPSSPDDRAADGKQEPGAKMGTDTEAEERLRDKQVSRRERVAWASVWPTARRAVLIGDPGEGKSVLARSLLRELAGRGLEELDAGQTPVGGLTTPVLMRLADLGQTADLTAALCAAVQAFAPPGYPFSDALVQHVVDTARTTTGTVILDGLDEAGSGRPQAEAHCATLAADPARLVLTSRPYGYQQGRMNLGPVDQFELAPLTQAQRDEFVTKWFARAGQADRQEAARRLAADPAILGMTENAFLLTLVLAEAELHPELPADVRRPDLYRWIVRDLVRGAWRPGLKLDESDARVDEQIIRLQEAGWQLLAPDPERSAFTGREWLTALRQTGQSLSEAGQQLNVWRDRGVLQPLLVKRPEGDIPGWAFIHRSLLEFLAAEQVASLPEQEMLKAVERYLWTGLAGEETWEPGAQDFLTFLAGCLPNPTAMLERIRREATEKPDLLFVMARLAGRCLADVRPLNTLPTDLVDDILARCYQSFLDLGESTGAARALAHTWAGRWAARHLDVFQVKKLVQKSGSELAVAELGRCLLAPFVDPDPDRYGYYDPERELLYAAATALRILGVGVGAAPVLSEIVLAHPNSSVRAAAASALGGHGATAVQNLRAALSDTIPLVRRSAAEALGQIGPAAVAATPDLQAALDDTIDFVSGAAADSLTLFGAASAVMPYLSLVSRISYEHEEHMLWVTDALRRLGPAAAAVVPDLRAVLDDPNWLSRRPAVVFLGRLGVAAAAVVPDLKRIALTDPAAAVRVEAVNALKQLVIAGVATVPDLQTALTDKVKTVRMEAAFALGRLGPAAAAAVPDLQTALADPEQWVREAAAWALGRLGPAAAAAVPSLQTALAHTDWSVRRLAASALGRLGVAVPPEVVSDLKTKLIDPDWNLRSKSAETLGELGPAAAAAVPNLRAALADPDFFVRREAAKALGAIGPAAAVVPRLRTALADPYWEVRETVAKALEDFLNHRRRLPPT